MIAKEVSFQVYYYDDSYEQWQGRSEFLKLGSIPQIHIVITIIMLQYPTLWKLSYEHLFSKVDEHHST